MRDELAEFRPNKEQQRWIEGEMEDFALHQGLVECCRSP